jgi:hypothetical protein
MQLVVLVILRLAHHRCTCKIVLLISCFTTYYYIIIYAHVVLTLTWYVVNEAVRVAFRLPESERILLLLPDYIFARDWITFIFSLRRPTKGYYKSYLFAFIFLIRCKFVVVLCMFRCRCHGGSQHPRSSRWILKGCVEFIFLSIFSTWHVVVIWYYYVPILLFHSEEGKGQLIKNYFCTSVQWQYNK